jgi:cytochrome c oxidase subunit 2
LFFKNKSAFVFAEYYNYDTDEPWGAFFQDKDTSQMEGLEELYNNIMFFLAIILFSVTWILIMLNYTKSYSLVKLIWTITPALILILIALGA